MSFSPIIEVENVHKSYGSNVVLQGISLQVQRGEMIGLVGRSGSGKSTLLHLLGGIDRNYQGSLSVHGQNLATLSDKQISRFRNEEVGFVFQAFHLLEHVTCLENVLLPNAFAKDPMSSEEAKKRASEVLKRVDLAGCERIRPAELSGGQKQRVAIARALFHTPKVLLCDEPIGNLDTLTARAIVDLFGDLNKEGLTLILVTHDELIPPKCNRVIQLLDGRIVA